MRKLTCHRHQALNQVSTGTSVNELSLLCNAASSAFPVINHPSHGSENAFPSSHVKTFCISRPLTQRLFTPKTKDAFLGNTDGYVAQRNSGAHDDPCQRVPTDRLCKGNPHSTRNMPLWATSLLASSVTEQKFDLSRNGNPHSIRTVPLWAIFLLERQTSDRSRKGNPYSTRKLPFRQYPGAFAAHTPAYPQTVHAKAIHNRDFT
jgi:hypothetical protein